MAQIDRQTHNLKVVGSNPTPATKKTPLIQQDSGVFQFSCPRAFLKRKHTVSGVNASWGRAVTSSGNSAAPIFLAAHTHGAVWP